MNRKHSWVQLFLVFVVLTSAAYADVSAFVGSWKLNKELSKIPEKITPDEKVVIRMDTKALILVENGVECLYMLNGKKNKSSRVENQFLIKSEFRLTLLSETSFRLDLKEVIKVNPSSYLATLSGTTTFNNDTIEFARTCTLRTPDTIVITCDADDRELIYTKE